MNCPGAVGHVDGIKAVIFIEKSFLSTDHLFGQMFADTDSSILSIILRSISGVFMNVMDISSRQQKKYANHR